MRILFMGTPDFAATCLDGLIKNGYDVCGVFTQPDKPKNRGMKFEQSPVKKLALENNIPVFTPAKLRDGTAMEIINELRPELICVVAYGKILPNDILDYPEYGCVNIHGSILPAYRGAAPIQWSVINGETETGVTAMYMAEAMDAGDIIEIRKTEIYDTETAGELFERLAVIGAELLRDTVDAIENGTATRTVQDERLVTFAPPLKKEMCPIDFTDTAKNIVNKIRGFNPSPVATCEINGTVFKVYEAKTGENDGKAPGEIVSADKKGLKIACADGAVVITKLQAPGGKVMNAADYLRGHKL